MSLRRGICHTALVLSPGSRTILVWLAPREAERGPTIYWQCFTVPLPAQLPMSGANRVAQSARAPNTGSSRATLRSLRPHKVPHEARYAIDCPNRNIYISGLKQPLQIENKASWTMPETFNITEGNNGIIAMTDFLTAIGRVAYGGVHDLC